MPGDWANHQPVVTAVVRYGPVVRGPNVAPAGGTATAMSRHRANRCRCGVALLVVAASRAGPPAAGAAAGACRHRCHLPSLVNSCSHHQRPEAGSWCACSGYCATMRASSARTSPSLATSGRSRPCAGAAAWRCARRGRGRGRGWRAARRSRGVGGRPAARAPGQGTVPIPKQEPPRSRTAHLDARYDRCAVPRLDRDVSSCSSRSRWRRRRPPAGSGGRAGRGSRRRWGRSGDRR
jgi:hypothetical protein